MSDKATLHLSINKDLSTLARASGLNLSAEFEEWIKIRLNQTEEDKPKVDTDFEIAKYRAEIQKLQSQKEIDMQKEDANKEQNMVLDNMIKNMKEFHEDFNNISDTRVHGIQFLIQKKFRKMLNPLEAKELLEKRIKELGLNG